MLQSAPPARAGRPAALPALVKLLADPDANVRYLAVVVLGNWGRKEAALPALVNLLADPDAAVRCRAAQGLGDWE